MKDLDTKTPTETETRIIAAAIRCFVRFGARKTSMNDIAGEAGMSRQTIYDLFGNKDELIRASILSISAATLARVAERTKEASDLDSQLRIYLEETVLSTFELLQSSGDPEDLISGHNEAGKSAIKTSHSRHRDLVADLLRSHMQAADAGAVERLANFLVSVAMSFKYVDDRDELVELLASLRQSVLATVAAS